MPTWTQPNPTKEEIRMNSGVPPPPQPLLPSEFVIQLYNPDQQVVVRSKPGSWNSSPSWDFELPQQSFRQPSNSSIDRTQNDPTASETTPKIAFRWKKEGKLSKDYVCAISGKSTNPDGSKRKHREPDIAVALFKRLNEITLYEPNLSRAELEDPKGLEVVIMLGAIVIREVFNGQLQEVFNISETPPSVPRISESPTSSLPASGSRPDRVRTSSIPSSNQHSQPSSRHSPRHSLPSPTQQRVPLQIHTSNPRPPPMDPRSQWEIDAETARLQKQVAHEERERRRAEAAETKRLKKMLEAEEREAARQRAESDRRKQAEINRETERLKREFDDEVRRAQQAGIFVQPPVQRPHSAQPMMSGARPLRTSAQGPYLQPLNENLQSQLFVSQPSATANSGKKVKAKKSFWGLGRGATGQNRLAKKSSSVF